MLSDTGDDLYHVAGDPDIAEALMRPREAASAVTVAAQVRAKILAGEYDSTGRAPSRADLAAKPPEGYGISLANASVVLRMLAAEGWVTLDQGRGSFLRPRRPFFVNVTIMRPQGAARARGEDAALRAAIDGAAGNSPAVAEVITAGTDDVSALVGFRVIAASPARAGDIAEDVVWSARTSDWSWDGWDRAVASVSARPA